MPTTGSTTSPPWLATARPMISADDQRHDPDGAHHPEPAPHRPARARPWRRQHHLEAPPALIARPAAQEEGAREPDDERAEAEERQLEDRRRLGQVEARVDRVDERRDLRQVADHLAEGIGRGHDEDAVQPDAEAPREGDARAVGELARERPGDARRQRRQPKPPDVRHATRDRAGRTRPRRPRTARRWRGPAPPRTASR